MTFGDPFESNYESKANKIKSMGYKLGPENDGRRSIIPENPIRFGYPEEEGFAEISVENGKITENTGDKTPKKSEWYLFGEMMGINTEITGRIRADSATEIWERREKINMKKYRKMKK